LTGRTGSSAAPAGTSENGIRQQLGDRRGRGEAAGGPPPVAIPVLARLVIKNTNSASRLWPAAVTWTTRLRKDAALYGLPPQRTGKRGRPRQKGYRLPALAELAATTAFTQVTVTRYSKTAVISAAAITGLWPSVFGTRQVTVALIRDRSAAGYDLALEC
jgi:hypothetical protein